MNILFMHNFFSYIIYADIAWFYIFISYNFFVQNDKRERESRTHGVHVSGHCL